MDGGVNVDVLGSLRAPLLSEQSERTMYSEDSDKAVQKGDFPPLASAALALLAVGGVSTSVAAMISVSFIAVYIAGGICIFNSLWIAVKHYNIAKGEGPRNKLNQLNDQLTLCQEEGEVLARTHNDLQDEADCMHEIQQELDDILSEQGQTLEEAVACVTENESILNQMKQNLRQVTMASLTRIVISSDRTGNMHIKLKELNGLTVRIKLALEEHGIDLDTDEFKALVRKDTDIFHVLKVIGAIVFKEESFDGKDFIEYAKEARQEEARQDDLIGSLLLSSSVNAHFRRLSTIVTDEVVHRTAMFTLNDRFTKGSVEVARGKEVSLSKINQGSNRSLEIKRKSLEDVPHRRAGRRGTLAKSINMRDLIDYEF